MKHRGKIYVHIGTHKTGSTSIQNFLSSHTGPLLRENILFPSAGRHLLGHHHIAWELREDERLGGLGGYLQNLLDELQGSSSETAVISSEDFEYMSRYPLQLRGFMDALRAVGYEPVLVAFFRERNAYLRSLATALANHGVKNTMEWYENALREHDAILVKKGWRFDFNRARFASMWTELTGAELIALDYDLCTADGGVVPAFLETLGAGKPLIEASRSWPRFNVRNVRVIAEAI